MTRRKAVPLAIAAVSLLAIVLLLLVPQLVARAQADARIVVAPGETVESNGYSFTLTASQEFVGEGTEPGGNSIPRGDSLVAALIVVKVVGDVPGSDENLACDLELTSRDPEPQRVWREVSDLSLFAYEKGEDRTAYCVLDGEEFELESVYLTPAGVYDSATIDLTVGDDQFRLQLER